MAFGVIACSASKVIMARRVGSAMAWKMSRLIVFKFLVCEADRLQIYAQLFGFANLFFRVNESQLDGRPGGSL